MTRMLLLLSLLGHGCGTSSPALDRGALDHGGTAADRALSDRGSAGDAAAGADAVAPCVRRILEAAVTNARDLGGHAVSGGRRTACRAFFRGGDLGGLDAAGCTELATLGVKTVVDLREPDIQQSQPPPACVAATRVLAPMPKLLPDTPANYLSLFKESAAVAKVFSVLGEASAYPVYVHCIIGRDRASFVTALVLSALGASRQVVIDEFKLSTDAGVAVKVECIEAVLDEVEKRGGIEATLGAMGVTPAQLAALRARMIP